MFVTRKEIKKILKFIELKDKAIAWLYQEKALSDYKMEYELLFDDIKRSFSCKDLVLDIDYKIMKSFKISNTSWVNENLEPIIFKFSYMKRKRLLKPFAIYYNTSNCKGLIPDRVDNILFEFSKQFLKDIDEQTKILEHNFNFLKIRQGKREFNEIYSEDKVLGEPFWRARDNSFSLKDQIVLSSNDYVNDVRALCDISQLEELKKELNSFFNDDGK